MAILSKQFEKTVLLLKIIDRYLLYYFFKGISHRESLIS